jgi:hypothetical protein
MPFSALTSGCADSQNSAGGALAFSGGCSRVDANTVSSVPSHQIFRHLYAFSLYSYFMRNCCVVSLSFPVQSLPFHFDVRMCCHALMHLAVAAEGLSGLDPSVEPLPRIQVTSPTHPRRCAKSRFLMPYAPLSRLARWQRCRVGMDATRCSIHCQIDIGKQS